MVGVVVFVGILFKFVLVLLLSILFFLVQMWQMYEICIWMMVVLFIVFMLILVSYMWFVKWLYMLVVLDLLVCQIYYVCDLVMLRDFERLFMLGKRERDWRVERMGRMYWFGWMIGVLGERRVGVDYFEGEQGYRMYGLGGCGFGIMGGK